MLGVKCHEHGANSQSREIPWKNSRNLWRLSTQVRRCVVLRRWCDFFFIHCHHISDWIIKLNRVGETKTAINKFINEHNELIICADLCNGQKHFRLERVRGDRQPHVSGKEWIITTYTPEADKPVIFRAKYRIVAGNEIYDALGLAEKCIDLWRGYIRVLALKAI